MSLHIVCRNIFKIKELEWSGQVIKLVNTHKKLIKTFIVSSVFMINNYFVTVKEDKKVKTGSEEDDTWIDIPLRSSRVSITVRGRTSYEEKIIHVRREERSQ